MFIFKKTTPELISTWCEIINVPLSYREEFIKRMAFLFENSKTSFNKKVLEIWGRPVYDLNPLHQDENYARNLKGFNFTTTPVFGTLISSNSELLINKIANEINLVTTKKVLYSGNQIKYGEPLYPEEELQWTLNKILPITDTDQKNLLGFNFILEGQKDNKKIVVNTTRFRYNRNSFDESELEKIVSSKNFVAEYEFNINYGDLNDALRKGGLAEYSFCSGYSDSKVPLMFPAALVPAGLLKLCYEKTGKYEGIYRTMDLEFYSRAKLGDFKTYIMNVNEPRERRGVFTYDFKGIVLQEGKPILSGKFVCISENKIDL
jgi:hypothetical protein